MWQEPKFDQHQFSHKARAVNATKTREGWDTSGLSFADYQSCHVHRKAQATRRLPTPQWTKTMESLRAVVLNYNEVRFYIRTHLGTDQERIERIQKRAEASLPSHQENLKRLLAKYHELVSSGKTEEAAKLAIQVQGIDSQIMVIKRGVVAITTAIAYLYYRLGWDSVTVAEQLRLKSPHVRATLKRMNDLAAQIDASGRLPEVVRRARNRDDVRKPWRWTGERLSRLFMMRTSGMSYAKCAEIYGLSAQTIAKVWKKYFRGLRTPTKRPSRKGLRLRRSVWSPEKLCHLFWLRVNGVSFGEAAKLLNVSKTSAHDSWHKYIKLKCRRGSRSSVTRPTIPVFLNSNRKGPSVVAGS